MTQDAYGEIINSTDTFQTIAHALDQTGTCMVGWTDGGGTHYDLLFAYKETGIKTLGNIQGGIDSNYLYVAIMRVGAFAFDITHIDTLSSYYQEKLGHNFGTYTGQKITELINGVKKALGKE